jgi:hypothetical protein
VCAGADKPARRVVLVYAPSVTETASAPALPTQLHRCAEELTAQELAELEQLLPESVIAHHLRWLETGEGEPWPESYS